MDQIKKIVTLDNLQQHTTNILKEVETFVIEQSTEIKQLIEKEVNSPSGAVSAEAATRKAADEALEALISEEKGKLEAADSNLQTLIQTEETNRQTAIAQEVGDRNAAIAIAKTDLEGKISALGTQINKTIQTEKADLSTLFQTADETVKALINSESNTRELADNALEALIKTEQDARKEQDAKLQEFIDQHITGADSLQATVLSHIQNNSNPHKVTTEEIGAAKSSELADLSTRVLTLETNTTLTDTVLTRLDEAEDNIEALAVSTIYSNKSNQSLNGDLTITKTGDTTGNLTVEGDLIVKGSTKTVKQETVEVADSLIVINSDAKNIAGINSGLAIRTSETDAYGIVYNMADDSVNLGFGQINNKGDFIPNLGSSRPILVRESDSNLTHGNLLVWDDVNKMAVDGGPVPTTESLSDDFASLSDHQRVAGDVEIAKSDIAGLKLKDQELTASLATLSQTTAEKVDSVPLNQNGTSKLNTISDDIVGAINEIHSSNSSHANNTNNPHNVTLSQLNAEPAIGTKNSAFNRSFSDSVPYMNGVGTAGTSILVSRADHIHPTDSSRAPTDHASSGTTYGQATDLLYGHVKVDTAISSSSTNPVQNRVIKNYIDDVGNLKVAKRSYSKGATIPVGSDDGIVGRAYIRDYSDAENSIELSYQPQAYSIPVRNANGNFHVSNPTQNLDVANKQFVETSIATARTELTGLVDSVSAVLTTQSNTLAQEIARATQQEGALEGLIAEEGRNRLAADNSLAESLNGKINSEVGTLRTLYDPIKDFVAQLFTLSNSKAYAAQWTIIDGVATPRWVSLDEGELN